MKAAYFPFTYISEPTARRLAALVGPVVVYQPIKTAADPVLDELASQGLVENRAPMIDDDHRLRAALSEFTEWARQNPGRSTAGADFLGARQGEVPFFDETAVNQIRSDIRQYGRTGKPAEEADDGFGVRLFLALAQENDQAIESLGQDLDRFKVMEKAFLEDLKDADEAGFNRQAHGGALWREDPGARMTGQRLRAWCRLVAADGQLPDVLVTTSPAVVDALLENAGDAGALEKLAEIRLDVSNANEKPLLGKVLSGFVDGSLPPTAGHAEAGLSSLSAESGSLVRLYATANLPLQTFVQELAATHPMQDDVQAFGHTLIVLVES